MPFFKTFSSGPLETNSYLIGADNSDMAVLIDAPPGCEAPVRGALESSGRRLQALLITHPHFDHTLDAAKFAHPGVGVYAHEAGRTAIASPVTLDWIPEPPGGFPGAHVHEVLEGGQSIEIAGLTMNCLEVPGHSPGSLAFLLPSCRLCFVGDLIFQGSVGRTDLPGGDFDTLAESIRREVYSLDDDVILYPGHGPATSVGVEKRTNPFVRG